MVTIILPVLNCIKYISYCLQSILQQTYKDWKLIIFDDGSTDGTIDIIEEFVKKEPRATLIKKNNSYIDNLNEGILLADTKYIARMDADDIMLPNRLYDQLKFLEENNDIDLHSSSVQIINENNEIIGYFSSFFPNHLIDAKDLAFMNQIVHPSVMFKKESIIKNNIKYNNDFKYAEDWELWVQMLEHNMKIYTSSTYLLKYRIVKNSMSRTHYNEIQNLSIKIKDRLFKLF